MNKIADVPTLNLNYISFNFLELTGFDSHATIYAIVQKLNHILSGVNTRSFEKVIMLLVLLL